MISSLQNRSNQSEYFYYFAFGPINNQLNFLTKELIMKIIHHRLSRASTQIESFILYKFTVSKSNLCESHKIEIQHKKKKRFSMTIMSLIRDLAVVRTHCVEPRASERCIFKMLATK